MKLPIMVARPMESVRLCPNRGGFDASGVVGIDDELKDVKDGNQIWGHWLQLMFDEEAHRVSSQFFQFCKLEKTSFVNGDFVSDDFFLVCVLTSEEHLLGSTGEPLWRLLLILLTDAEIFGEDGWFPRARAEGGRPHRHFGRLMDLEHWDGRISCTEGAGRQRYIHRLLLQALKLREEIDVCYSGSYFAPAASLLKLIWDCFGCGCVNFRFSRRCIWALILLLFLEALFSELLLLGAAEIGFMSDWTIFASVLEIPFKSRIKCSGWNLKCIMVLSYLVAE
ncbi:hypothetical protein U1Q18_003401 [Sarracenia purpurea var. burkii]